MKSNAWILNLLILGAIPISIARVILISVDNIDDRDIAIGSGIKSSHESLIVRKPEVKSQNLIQKIIDSLSQKQIEPNITKNKCIRLFGSIYGAKYDRLKCQQKSKSKIRMPAKRLSYLDKNLSKSAYSDPHYANKVYQYTEYPGFTNKIDNHSLQSGKKSLDVTTSNMNKFSSDYIDFQDIGSRAEPIKIHWNYRKSLPNVVHKRNMYVEMSDDENNRDLKRFKVIKKKKKGLSYSDSDDSESVEEGKSYVSDGDSSMEQENRGKKHNFGRDVSESEASAENDNSIEYYIQGSKVVAASPNGGYRRRLPTFLPKRYHWEEDDIHNLGYYWFNGPQGRYPYYAVRP